MSTLSKLFGPDPHTTDLSLDDIAHLLRVERRRIIIRQLEAVSDSIDTRTLSEQVAMVRHGSDFTATERKTDYVTLYQNHLPELDDHDVIEYNQNRNIIRRGPEFDAARAALDSLEEVVATDGGVSDGR